MPVVFIFENTATSKAMANGMIAKKYILFDGTCGFCMKTALCVMKADSKKYFLSVSTSSDLGKKLLQKHDLVDTAIHSIILMEGDSYRTKSEALREILIQLPRWKIIGNLMFLLPVFFMNRVYDIVAAIRHYLPAAKSCKIPDSKLSERVVT